MIGLMKYKHKKNLRTDRQRRRGKDQLVPRLVKPPRLARREVSIHTTLEYVRARRYATTGWTGLGLHGTARAELRSIGSRRTFTKDLTAAGRGPDLVRPGMGPRAGSRMLIRFKLSNGTPFE